VVAQRGEGDGSTATVVGEAEGQTWGVGSERVETVEDGKVGMGESAANVPS
jgi:hypothetical protein